MLCKYIKEGKLILLDEENFCEIQSETFIYNDDKLHIINVDN